jgi:hypothetical protein
VKAVVGEPRSIVSGPALARIDGTSARSASALN